MPPPQPSRASATRLGCRWLRQLRSVISPSGICLGKTDHQGDNKRRRHATHPSARISKPAFVLRRQSSRRRGWLLATHGRYGRGRRHFLARTFQTPLYCYDRCGKRSDTEVKEAGFKERHENPTSCWQRSLEGGHPPRSLSITVRRSAWGHGRPSSARARAAAPLQQADNLSAQVNSLLGATSRRRAKSPPEQGAIRGRPY